MDKRIPALFAALVATSIFGFNHTIAKELMPDVLSPNALSVSYTHLTLPTILLV